MKYLGVEIRTDGWGFYCSKTEGVYFGIDNLKSDIRKLVLPTYKPTKTLEWLKKKTGVEWIYKKSGFLVYSDDELLIEYDIAYKGCWVMKNGIDVVGTNSNFKSMTPREFIDKIEKGEWD